MTTATRVSSAARVGRVFSTLNWEMHVLQSGVHTFALRNRWLGLPASIALLVVVWTIYWLAVPILLALWLLALLIRPLESRWRDAR